MDIEFSHKRAQARSALPWDFEPHNPQHVESILHQLEHSKPSDFLSAKHWFSLFHELSCAVSETQTLRQLKCQQHVGQQDHEKSLAEFDRNIAVLLSNSKEKLMEIYLNSPWRHAMHGYDKDRIFDDLKCRKQLINNAGIKLQADESQVVYEYQKFSYDLETNFLGQTVKASSVLGYFHHQQESIRQKSYESYWACIDKNKEKFENYFEKLYENRISQAKIFGFKNYTEQAFVELGRNDYTPEDCANFRKSIYEIIVPLVTEISKKEAMKHNRKKIEPWNANFWSSVQPEFGLKQTSFEPWLNDLGIVLQRIHPSFFKLFKQMQEEQLFDIKPRKDKLPGAFTAILHETKRPFLFAHFSPKLKDTFLFFHEFGHCLHAFATTQIDNILLRQPGLEFCEFASMGLEYLARPFFHLLWPRENDALLVQKYQLIQALTFWPFMAMIDEWQHEIYSVHKPLNAITREKLWISLSHKYQPHVQWDLCPHSLSLGWLSRSHVFSSPFYYIDYGIAQIGALQLWKQSEKNFTQTVHDYIKALSLGGQVSLWDLFHTAGSSLDFGPSVLTSLSQTIAATIDL